MHPFRNIENDKREKQTLIVFGEDWGAHPSSTQHIMKHMKKYYHIIWINSLGLRRPQFSTYDMKRAFKKIFNRTHKETPAENDFLAIINPHAISWPGNKIVQSWNKEFVSQQINNTLIRHNVRNPIIWASLPSAISIIKNYTDCKIIYYCGDDFSSLAGVDHNPVNLMERELEKFSDLIITCNESLYKKFDTTKTHIVEHGVDFELFSQASPKAKDVDWTKKTIGFYGSIHEWIDQDLITQAASACEDWDFILIGNHHTDISKLRRLPNIKILGARDHSELPQYVQHWDYSLLPFKRSKQIEHCNPLKLREYLSAGRPIISTEFPAINDYRHKVQRIKNADHLIKILKSQKPSYERNSAEEMRNLDWSNKAYEIEKLIKKIK